MSSAKGAQAPSTWIRAYMAKKTKKIHTQHQQSIDVLASKYKPMGGTQLGTIMCSKFFYIIELKDRIDYIRIIL